MEQSGLLIDLFVRIRVRARSLRSSAATFVCTVWRPAVSIWEWQEGGGKQATCQLMTNIVHFQPICFLCALDEVSDESNLWSGPHTDNEQYVFGRERCIHQLGLPQWALWWMRAIIVDACDFSSMWTTNIGLTPQMSFFFPAPSLSLSLTLFLVPLRVTDTWRRSSRWLGSSNGAKIYYAIIVVAF